MFDVLVVETYFMLCVRVKGHFTGFTVLCVFLMVRKDEVMMSSHTGIRSEAAVL